MTHPTTFTLINKQTGHLAFKLFSFDDGVHFDHLQRLNYYSLIWIKEGKGTLTADFADYPVNEQMLFAFSPYQPFMLQMEGGVSGTVLQFHPDFFCIHKHQQEIACHGVLFNNIYQAPYISVDEQAQRTFEMVLSQIRDEMQTPALTHHDLLVSYLKIFLITATRQKTGQREESAIEGQEPFILKNLKNYIEAHYKSLHTASDYAGLLNISPKALAKLAKTHFNKTLTDLIAERIVIEAKRELYLTNKPVKQIAWELGYEDEYYFSRFFKNRADVSPQLYRETVGFSRALAE
ncbi:helix-turn-helix domain-containing protein [Telluribacter humicola]|uniref:helix-turn-helix domain-containing protein n=1 Tax=Telluribacter humicola TaxID=1720261 RepID=UPI001A959037|nr:helix-turn-helix domain-containing protein [Telluribacter humicola]